jgi:hypothetical protein
MQFNGRMDDLQDFGPEKQEHVAAGDIIQEQAYAKVRGFFEAQPEKVFFSRQVEVFFEDEFFHWVSNRAIRQLESEGRVLAQVRSLRSGGTMKLLWHRSYRYYRRSAKEVEELVNEYAHPNIGAALGSHGELMVLEGFAKQEFVLKGRNTNSFRGKVWAGSGHDLDFIFERDSRGYGVEVKNTLAYMEYDELRSKIQMCADLGIRPVFAVRMLPKSWINEVWQAGGFALILKYQLYPVAHKELAKRVRGELQLPVDAPKALSDSTVERFVKWHLKQL